MKLFHSSKKAALSLLAGTAVVLAFVAGAAAQRVDDYRGGGMPALEVLKKNFLRLNGGGLELVEIVGKAPLENSGWQVYYYAKDRQGGVFVDDKMTLTKLDSDIWIMHVRTAGPETTQWGIVTQY